MMLGWSTVSWAQAWQHDRTSFYLGRAFIGLFEGGFIPGIILFATYFYKTKELAVRLAIFWSTLNVARVISALLAAGILEMRGVAGKPGWFWLFLIEGLLTGVIGFTSYLYLPASPTDTKNVLWPKGYYTEREEVIMVNRILRDDPAKGLTAIKEAASFRDIWEAWKDPAMWGLYFIGLPWLHSWGSGRFGAVGRDAAHLASVIKAQLRRAPAAPHGRVPANGAAQAGSHP